MATIYSLAMISQQVHSEFGLKEKKATGKYSRAQNVHTVFLCVWKLHGKSLRRFVFIVTYGENCDFTR